MKRYALLVPLFLGACSSLGLTGNPTQDAPTLYKLGCAGVSTADGAFQAAAPALVVAGKLTQADLDKEKALFAIDQNRCANPPILTDANGNPVLDANGNPQINYSQAAIDLVADASAIYLMLAVH